MPTNVNEIIKNLGHAKRKKVEARAAQLIAEEMTRQELRRAFKLTQARMAKTLGVTQDSISRLEKRSDLLLSTLRQYIEAMGGKLSLVAEFPGREAVILSGIAEVKPGPKGSRRKPVDRIKEVRQANRGKPASAVNDLRRKRGLPQV